MTLNHVMMRSFEGNEKLLIAITPRSTLTLCGSICLEPIYVSDEIIKKCSILKTIKLGANKLLQIN